MVALIAQTARFVVQLLGVEINSLEGRSLINGQGYYLGLAKGSAHQGWVVGEAHTDLQNGPTNGGVISTRLPTKFLSLASPELKPKARVV